MDLFENIEAMRIIYYKILWAKGPEKIETVKKIDKNANIKYPHKTGLQNIGQTSYMNSTIQCLSNIKYLSDYFIKYYGQFNLETQPLSASFSSLVFELFNIKKKYISPEIFKKIISKLNPSFEGMHEADPKDLISVYYKLYIKN